MKALAATPKWTSLAAITLHSGISEFLIYKQGLAAFLSKFLYANSRSIYTLSMTKNQALVMRMGTRKTFFQSRLEVCCVRKSMYESLNQRSQLYSFFFDMWGLIDFTTSWMVILSWTKTFFSFSSHRISFLFSAFWKRRQNIKACLINWRHMYKKKTRNATIYETLPNISLRNKKRNTMPLPLDLIDWFDIRNHVKTNNWWQHFRN